MTQFGNWVIYCECLQKGSSSEARAFGGGGPRQINFKRVSSNKPKNRGAGYIGLKNHSKNIGVIHWRPVLWSSWFFNDFFVRYARKSASRRFRRVNIARSNLKEFLNRLREQILTMLKSTKKGVQGIFSGAKDTYGFTVPSSPDRA